MTADRPPLLDDWPDARIRAGCDKVSAWWWRWTLLFAVLLVLAILFGSWRHLAALVVTAALVLVPLTVMLGALVNERTRRGLPR